jgi:DHA1 family tetracycline resistance protein-like MFS transporter
MSDPQPVALNGSLVEPPAPPKRALLTIFLIVFVDLLGFGLIIPLLPFYARTFNASPVQVTLLFSTYSICQFIASPILGALSDRFGRRPVLFCSQIGSVVGYLLLGWTTHWQHSNLALGLSLIYLSRVIDGLSGGNISTAQAYISDVTTQANRARGMGLLGAAFGMGFVLGPAVGLGLSYLFGPSVPAYTAGGFSAIAAVMTFLYLPESRVHKPAESEAWLHPRVFLPILKRPVLVQLMLIWFIAMAAFVMIDSTIVMYLNDVFKYEEKNTFWYFVFVGLIIVIVQGGLIRPLTRRASEWFWSALGPMLVAVGYVITMTSAWEPAAWILVVGGATYAIGRSIQQPTIQSLVSKCSTADEQGVTFGLFQGTGTIARVIGPLIAGPVYAQHVAGPLVTAAVLAAIAGVWTIALRQSFSGPLQNE